MRSRDPLGDGAERLDELAFELEAASDDLDLKQSTFVTTRSPRKLTMLEAAPRHVARMHREAGLWAPALRKVTLTDTEFTFNSAGRDAGGLSVGGNDITATRVNISDNTAGESAGGIEARSIVSIVDSTISRNRSANFGAGIQMNPGKANP